jgi:hypothetical protein
VAVAASPELVDLFVVSPAAMVVLAYSAVLRDREKTTVRPAFRTPQNGWSAVGKAPAMAS